ncbi:response regulator transcription factor [Pedobacter metabolipauper]|uniref:Response regulator receiver domain-containing protein n=1 Tax=Pedobacter metabolipauper TaxID=425513 RepID=A0A4V3D1G2_9SPHI|nr:response regulator [Pedobacter metabolipauper]TDQ11083.1 response regulator receiver domain-containing protein [Pedobacter metabolipauper]
MKKCIYIVEDNEDIGYILQYYLSEEGFDVHLFETVSAFNKAVNKTLPDLFLLDVRLPDGDGLEVCAAIKNREKSGKIPVLMMSAHFPEDLMRKKSCADGFLPKPFDLSIMLEKVNQFLPAA